MTGADRYKKKPSAIDAGGIDLSPGDIYQGLRTFVAPAERVPPAPVADARPVLPGLVEAPVVVHRDGLARFLSTDAYDQLGGESVVWSTARDNLRTIGHLRVDRQRVYEPLADTTVVFLSGDSFVASRVGDLTWVIDQLDAVYRPMGVLVAVPDNTTLIFHVVTGEGVLAVTLPMATSAQRLFTEAGDRGVSPQVFYVAPDGRAEGIVRYQPGQAPVTDTTGLLGELLFGPPPKGLDLH
jgi:hypothetical protein